MIKKDEDKDEDKDKDKNQNQKRKYDMDNMSKKVRQKISKKLSFKKFNQTGTKN